MERIDLDLNKFASEEAVHDFLAERMHFPDYYGKNLDALNDMLTEGLSQNYCLCVVPCRDENAPLAAFGKKLMRLLEDDAETIDEQDGVIYAVFTDKSPEADPWNWFRGDPGDPYSL